VVQFIIKSLFFSNMGICLEGVLHACMKVSHEHQTAFCDRVWNFKQPSFLMTAVGTKPKLAG